MCYVHKYEIALYISTIPILYSFIQHNIRNNFVRCSKFLQPTLTTLFNATPFYHEGSSFSGLFWKSGFNSMVHGGHRVVSRDDILPYFCLFVCFYTPDFKVQHVQNMASTN